MKTGTVIFDAAMGLMDELDGAGNPENRDTEEYRNRALGIVNMMICEYRILAGLQGEFAGAAALEDPIPEMDDAYTLGAMQYGLAANLLVDENPAAAAFFQQRYEELRNLFFARRECGGEEIENLYGGVEFGRFGHW